MCCRHRAPLGDEQLLRAASGAEGLLCLRTRTFAYLGVRARGENRVFATTRYLFAAANTTYLKSV